MRIATWNVNSVRQRLDHLLGFLASHQPDVLCLQELKCQEADFPRLEVESAGYNAAVLGQKGFNGVALLSRHNLEDVRRGLPGDDGDEQARYIEAVVAPKGGAAFRVASIYLPNGNPLGSSKFPYKLAWMARLEAHARTLMQLEEPLVLAGDYNVIPEAEDAANPEQWLGDALFQPESRGAWRALAHLGLTDALHACRPEKGLYTFWDYQAGSWQRDNGIRIDHLMVSPQAADRLDAVSVYREARAWDKPSDHVPVIADFI